MEEKLSEPNAMIPQAPRSLQDKRLTSALRAFQKRPIHPESSLSPYKAQYVRGLLAGSAVLMAIVVLVAWFQLEWVTDYWYLWMFYPTSPMCLRWWRDRRHYALQKQVWEQEPDYAMTYWNEFHLKKINPSKFRTTFKQNILTALAATCVFLGVGELVSFEVIKEFLVILGVQESWRALILKALFFQYCSFVIQYAAICWCAVMKLIMQPLERRGIKKTRKLLSEVVPELLTQEQLQGALSFEEDATQGALSAVEKQPRKPLPGEFSLA